MDKKVFNKELDLTNFKTSEKDFGRYSIYRITFTFLLSYCLFILFQRNGIVLDFMSSFLK